MGCFPALGFAMRLIIYQPDIAANFGALLRLAACFAVPVEVIEPCGFPLDDRRMRRAGMDYFDRVTLRRHASWPQFLSARPVQRLVLLTTAGEGRFPDVDFRPDDGLLFGRESAGVPEEVHRAADLRLRIPLAPGLRSLNVVAAAAMVLGEALRQTRGFPTAPERPA
jgi:tRNA (cytidine/uridine-2'-O-)-methyltransferase